ncbi:hypothetical protein [Mucilaginibacter rubeus]|uniref:Uncharacterized protein n=1 Tax=Mucilaginibacter rubeus TaxID=2027860 RepID=A0A5C1HTV1_9SPHI|nr:hypothetical protein [Mucilaginibacter rubeus]QEM09302.1 hypothetical protein DEO27_004490 [Mucilaginibacter rubeus]
MEAQKFKIGQAGYEASKKNTVIWAITAIVIVIIAFGYYTYEPRNGADAMWVGLLVFLILLYGFLVFRILKKLKAAYDSYVITIDELTITREQKNLLPRSILLSDITAIIKSTNGAFTIKGKTNDPANTIIISKLIDDREALALVLEGIKPITVNTRPTFKEKYGRWVSIAILLPLLGVYLIDNKIVVSICAGFSVVLYTVAFFKVLKNKDGMSKPKKSLINIVWLLLLVLAISYFKLIA